MMSLFAAATIVPAKFNGDKNNMAHENWQLVKEVFADALRQTPEVRPEFLDRVCCGDKILRREVESLLSSLDGAENFMETPAITANDLSFDLKNLPPDSVGDSGFESNSEKSIRYLSRT